jgi:hypothetical protein
MQMRMENDCATNVIFKRISLTGRTVPGENKRRKISYFHSILSILPPPEKLIRPHNKIHSKLKIKNLTIQYHRYQLSVWVFLKPQKTTNVARNYPYVLWYYSDNFETETCERTSRTILRRILLLNHSRSIALSIPKSGKCHYNRCTTEVLIWRTRCEHFWQKIFAFVGARK